MGLYTFLLNTFLHTWKCVEINKKEYRNAYEISIRPQMRLNDKNWKQKHECK